jgi:hypothetical protein
VIGRLNAKAGNSYYNYGYDNLVFLNGNMLENRLQGENYSVGGDYSKRFGGLSIYGDAMVNLLGELSGHYLVAGAGYRIDENNELTFEINSKEHAPDFNFLLYQSDYINYNWETGFENQQVSGLNIRLDSDKWVQVDASVQNINNYAYFSVDEEGNTKPFQYSGNVNYIKVKAEREIGFGKFALYNTLMYQKVTEGGQVFNVPEFITRNSLFYRDHWFQKALYLQTGFTFKYFTAYNMDAYDPLLAEFYVQNEQALGGYPVVDFFFNGKVRQTRIFLKLEHLNSLVTGNNNFSAPDYPYRDFLVRFGLVWNFFM